MLLEDKKSMYLKAPLQWKFYAVPLNTIFHLPDLFNVLYNIFKAGKWTWNPFWFY